MQSMVIPVIPSYLTGVRYPPLFVDMDLSLLCVIYFEAQVLRNFRFSISNRKQYIYRAEMYVCLSVLISIFDYLRRSITFKYNNSRSKQIVVVGK